MTKMTYIAALNNAIAAITDTETIERLTALKTSLEKRAEKAKTYERKPSKTTQENATIAQQIAEYLREQGQPLTSAEIAEGLSLDKRKVAALVGRADAIEAVRVNSKLTKWQAKA